MISSPQGLSSRTLTHGGNGALKQWVSHSSHIHHHHHLHRLTTATEVLQRQKITKSASSWPFWSGVASLYDCPGQRPGSWHCGVPELSWLLALMLEEEEEEAAGAFVKECTDLTDITASFTSFRVLSVWVFELKWYLWLNMRYLSTCCAVIDYLIYFTEGLSDW